ncbi:MAG: DUF4406 domain-containing protein [Clostridia bacterium]|nr:DUF4406 domain-containing protein [Clostridia bacterium]
MKIYLAGPIIGEKNYKENFAKAQSVLEEQGHTVINPAFLPEGLGDYNTYMSICFPMIDVADAVVLLDGWEYSSGACREWGYAFAKDKILVSYDSVKDVKTK